MSADSSTDGRSRTTRTILGDVTNRQGKRGWMSVSGNSDIKFGDGNGKNIDEKERDLQFTKKVCLGVENIVKEKCRTTCVVNDNEKGKRICISPRPCSEINSLCGNMVSAISNISGEVKESVSLDSSLHVGGSNVVTDDVIEVCDLSRDSCVSSISIPKSSALGAGDICGVEDKGDNDETRVISGIVGGEREGEQLVNQVCQDGVQDVGVKNMLSGNLPFVGCSRLPKPPASKSFEPESCVGLKGDGSSNSNGGIDLMKSCSCSFCIKAAYIWSDLHYQDMKGRIAVLKKSQKEAGMLVQRSCRDKGTDKHGQGNSNKCSKLESDLTNQWRSLFLHMEDIFCRECTQLESSLLTLKDLRESCKTDLEIIKGKSSDKQ